MSKNGKFRVSVDGKFLGHYTGHTPQDAIQKAIKANYVYHKAEIDNCKQFELKRGQFETTIAREGVA